MVLNSVGDWFLYGCGLLVVVYAGAKLLPDLVVSCTLVQYRAYRRLCIGIQQIREELPLEKNEPKYLPAQPVTETAVAASDEFLQAQAGTQPDKTRPFDYDLGGRCPAFATDEEALTAS